MNKKIVLLFAFCLSTIVSFGQDCPKPTKEKYKKVMSSAFAKEFKDCPVIIDAVYFKEGFLNGYRKPKKIKKMYFFQCTDDTGTTKSAGLTNEVSGDFFVINKDLADKVLDLEKGNKISVTGTTFVQNYFGTELGVYFIVKDIVKVE